MKAMESDADNLRRFAATGDEKAFRAIVERHGAMVHGVAWRRTNDRTLAEDVTQKVFTILARKASALSHQEIAGWLHRAAFVEARNAQRKEARQRKALTELTESMNDPTPAQGVDWQGVRPHIDELLGQLSSHDRQLVVLRFYEQQSYREISQAAGGSEDSIRKRVDRSLERLAGMLKQRGVTAQGSSLGVLLAAEPLCPHRVSAAHISGAAIKSAAVGGLVLPASFYLMTTSTKMTLTAAAALILLAVPATIVATRRHDDGSSAKSHANASPDGGDPAAALAQPSEAAVASKRPRPSSEATKKGGGEETVDLSGLAALFESGGMRRIMEGEVKVDSATQFNRLSARLKLNDDQKKKLQAYYDHRNQAASDALAEAEKRGYMDNDLTDNDREAIVELAKKHGLDQSPDALLREMLTPNQYADQVRVAAEQLTESTADFARKQLGDITKYVDLTGAERDKVFEALSQYHMDREAQGLDLLPLIRGTNEADVNMLKQVLTPEQLDTLQKGQSEESRQFGEMLNKAHEKDGGQ